MIVEGQCSVTLTQKNLCSCHTEPLYPLCSSKQKSGCMHSSDLRVYGLPQSFQASRRMVSSGRPQPLSYTMAFAVEKCH